MVAIATTVTKSPQRRVPSRPVLVVLPPVTRPEARVYRRRRLALLCAVLSVLVLPALLVAASGSSHTVTPASTAAPAVAPARSVYVVQPGDTLWSIAQKLDPTGDPRETVDRLVDLNGGSALQPGQRLRLHDN